MKKTKEEEEEEEKDANPILVIDHQKSNPFHSIPFLIVVRVRTCSPRAVCSTSSIVYSTIWKMDGWMRTHSFTHASPTIDRACDAQLMTGHYHSMDKREYKKSGQVAIRYDASHYIPYVLGTRSFVRSSIVRVCCVVLCVYVFRMSPWRHSWTKKRRHWNEKANSVCCSIPKKETNTTYYIIYMVLSKAVPIVPVTLTWIAVVVVVEVVWVIITVLFVLLLPFVSFIHSFWLCLPLLLQYYNELFVGISRLRRPWWHAVDIED